MTARDLDLVLWGATGFTGQLTAEHLVERGAGLRWALAGRSRAKLEATREQLGAEGVPLVVADAHDRASLDALARSARVVLSTVGPYGLHGEPLVAACVEAGTDLCDLTGEVPFMARMIGAHGERAKETGARVVHACGFDSIPSDLGVALLQREAEVRGASSLDEVHTVVTRMRGALSGGTVASMLHVVEQATSGREVRRELANPYALCPPEGRSGARQPSIGGVRHDGALGLWTAPFVMAGVNRAVVLRSHALRTGGGAAPLRYGERLATGAGLGGRLAAWRMAAGLGAFTAAAAVGPLRRLLQRTVLPKPGEGPGREARERGHFEFCLYGAPEGPRVRIHGDRDPGYGATARMVGEAALALARGDAPVGGGFWTPSTAFGPAFAETLRRHAGVRFELESAAR